MFASLHNHTQFSVLDSTIRIKDLFKRAKELNYPAVAITDHSVSTAVWDGFKASKETGVKMIIGAEMYFRHNPRDNDELFKHIILLAKNAEGYRNLLTLQALGYENIDQLGKRAHTCLDWNLLEKHSAGLICLTACGNGILAQDFVQKKPDAAEEHLAKLRKIFGDENLGLEIQAHNLKRLDSFYSGKIEQAFINRQLINLGKKHGIRVVATCNAHYATKEDAKTHDILLAIASGQSVYSNYRLKYDVEEFYLKDESEMLSFFARNYGEEKAREFVDNSIYFADLCEEPKWIEPKFSNPSGKELPEFPVKDSARFEEFKLWVQEHPERVAGIAEDCQFMRFLCETSPRFLAVPEEKREEYWQRLEKEYDVIESKGFASYMLIVADFLEWATNQSILVGPGRGCARRDTLVLTTTGYKQICDIHPGDKVYTHTGSIKEVEMAFQYDVSESLIEVETENQQASFAFTSDHKVWAAKGDDLPSFIELGKLGVGDFICAPEMDSELFKAGTRNKILSLKEVKTDKVYDIQVADDHSYITANYAVHNSCGGSIIGYYLNIHQADPIKYGLIFERFQNKEKMAYPDIDCDIAPSGRDRVMAYLSNKYGADHVAQISNYNRITPKVYVKDLCRALELGGGKEEAAALGQTIADTIPSEVKSIDEALKTCPLFAEYANKYPELAKYKIFDGLVRSIGTHAAGFIIGRRPIVGLVPYRREKDGSTVVEFEKERAEECGLVKMDLLGLATLDILTRTYDLIRQGSKEVRKFDYETYDKEACELIAAGNTFGVFQFGTSGGTIDLCRKVKPMDIMEISNINALARPSSKDIRTPYVETKDGKRALNLAHPSLERAFGKTLGFGLYEEGLLFLALDVAGWDLNKADGLRKLTKDKGKNPEKVKKLRQDFIDGAEKKGLGADFGRMVWDDVVNAFNGYGFNASHSILYSITTYHTAFLKAHYPVEFLLANLLAEIDGTGLSRDENIAKIKSELRANSIEILAPDLNKSEYSYKILEGNKLLTGFGALKGVGEEAIEDIVSKRPFKDFTDFIHRTDSAKVRSPVIQALAATGCLDGFGLTRRNMYLYASDYRAKLTSWCKKHDISAETFPYPFPEGSEWTQSEKFAMESKFIGEAFCCIPALAYGDFFRSKDYAPWRSLKLYADRDRVKSIKAIVRDVFSFKVKKESSKYFGQDMFRITLEDPYGESFQLVVFPNKTEGLMQRMAKVNPSAKLENGWSIHFSGTVSKKDDETSILFDELYNIIPPPAEPTDLAAKKVYARDIKQPKIVAQTKEELFDKLSDFLSDSGMIKTED
jgi:DNA polymerase III alpha subunit